MKSLALLLFLTVGTLEQSYGPYARPERGGHHAATSGNGNVLLAWSENDAAGHARVRVVLLHASGRAISPIHELPVLSPSRDALAPAVGTDGTSFIVVWEEVLGMQQTVAMAVDPKGTPAGEPQRLGLDMPILSNDYPSARVHWTGDSYVVLTGSRNIVRAGADARMLGALPGPAPEAISKNGTYARTEYAVIKQWTGFLPFNNGQWIDVPTVRWWAGSRSGSDTVKSMPSAPYITAAGNDFVVVWTTADMVSYRVTNTTRAGFPADVDEFARPRVQCTGTRCVIVYATRSHDVEGIVVDPANPFAMPERFTAAASDRLEREPEVTLIGNNRALVTWRSTGPDGERLAGRTILLNAVKQRAVN